MHAIPSTGFRRRAVRDERGQTSGEYVGALTLVIVVVTALSLVVGTGIAGAVLRGTSQGICKVIESAGLGGNCTTGSQGASPNAYQPRDCIVSSGESKVSGAVTIFSVRVGGDAGYVLEEKAQPDGSRKWYLTLKAGAGVGAEGAFGASGGSKGADVGGGASGRAYVVARGEGSVTYRFDAKEQAEAELAEIKRSVAPTKWVWPVCSPPTTT